MTTVVESTQVEKEVTFLVDPKPKFVSLVKRGANQMPWTVVKSQKEDDGVAVRRVLRTIIAPENVSEEALKAVVGEDARFDQKKQIGNLMHYDQLPPEVLKSDQPAEFVTLDAAQNISGLVVHFPEEALKSGNFLTRLFKPSASPVNALELDESVKADLDLTARIRDELIYSVFDEYWKFDQIFFGVMGQTETTFAQKLDLIRTAWSGFEAKLQSVATALGGEVSKSDKFGDAYPFLNPFRVEEIQKAGKKMSKARQAALTSAIETLTSILKEVEDGQEVEKEKTATTTTTPEPQGDEEDMKPEDVQKMIDESLKPTVDGLAQITEALKAVTETQTKTNEALAAVNESVEKMQKSVPGVVGDHSTDDQSTEAEKTDDEKAREEANKADVFRGLIFRTGTE
jgi:hypothetical protein